MSPNDQDMITKVVLAGTKIMYDAKTFPILKQGINKKMPLSDKLATETAGIMKMLKEKSKGKMPMQVILPAATALMLDLAHFMQQTKAADPAHADLRAAYPKLILLLGKVFSPAAVSAGKGAIGTPPAGAQSAAAPQPPAPQSAPPAVGGMIGGQ